MTTVGPVSMVRDDEPEHVIGGLTTRSRKKEGDMGQEVCRWSY